MTSEYYYTKLGETIVSVTAKAILDTNLFSVSGGSVVYQLGIDGNVVDSHEHKTCPKAGSMYAVLEQGGKKRSIQVDVSHRMFKIKYKLLVDDKEVTLTKTTEKELKAIWHERAMST